MIEHFAKMKESAKDVAQAVSDGLAGAFKAATDEVKELLANWSSFASKAASEAGVKNSGVTAQLGLDVARVQAEAAAKALEAATVETENLIKAEAAVQVALLEKAAAEKKAANVIKANEAAVTAATESRLAAQRQLTAAEDNAADLQSALNVLNSDERRLVGEWMTLKTAQNRSVEELTRGGMDYAEALKFQRDTARNLAAFEDENADFLERRKSLVEQANGATARIAEAERALTAATIKENEATAKLTASKLELEALEIRNKTKIAEQLAAVEDAKIAIEKKAQAEREAAEKVAEAAELEKKTAEEKERRAKELDEKRKSDQERIVAKVEGRVDENLKEEKKEPSKKKDNITVNANAVAKVPEVEEGQKKQIVGFNQWRKQELQKQQGEKQRADEIGENTRAMVDFLKGNGTEEWRQQFFSWLQNSGMTKEEMQSLGKAAADRQLLSRKELIAQHKTMQALLASVQDALTAK